MESLIKEWDGDSIILRFDRPANTWIIVVIHSTRLGPATGGTRMKEYPHVQAALQDAQRLAKGMSYKWAAAGLDAGGGKAVMAIPPDLDLPARTDLLRRYGAFIHQLRGLFLTGPDLGTTSEDMDIIAENAAPYVFCRTLAAGGSGNPGPFTALGVFTAIQVAVDQLFGDASLQGKQVLVQGVGSVGGELIQLLRQAGAEISFSDVDEATIHHFRDQLGMRFVPPDEVYDIHCDIFAPCALGGVLNEKTIPRLRCRAVVGGANNQLATSEDAVRLRERQILYAPDFVTNSGGAIAAIGIETGGWSPADARERVAQLIKRNLSEILELATSQEITPDTAAQRIADRRLARAVE
jgi:leucine dehydrogenase